MTERKAYHESLRYHMRHLVKDVETAWATSDGLCKICGTTFHSSDAGENAHALLHMDAPGGFTSESVAALTTLFMLEKDPYSVKDGLRGMARRFFGERARGRF